MASDAETIKAMAHHLTQLAQLLLEHVTEAPQTVQAAPQAVQVVRPASQAPWLCPEHGTAKVVPAGVSRKTGVPYDSFTVCGEYGCNRKPGRDGLPPRAVPPSQQTAGPLP